MCIRGGDETAAHARWTEVLQIPSEALGAGTLGMQAKLFCEHNVSPTLQRQRMSDTLKQSLQTHERGRFNEVEVVEVRMMVAVPKQE